MGSGLLFRTSSSTFWGGNWGKKVLGLEFCTFEEYIPLISKHLLQWRTLAPDLMLGYWDGELGFPIFSCDSNSILDHVRRSQECKYLCEGWRQNYHSYFKSKGFLNISIFQYLHESLNIVLSHSRCCYAALSDHFCQI